MRVVLLAHELFPGRAKTAVGILRYADHEVVAVLDRDLAGDRVSEHVPDVQDAPIVAEVEDAPDCDALVVGVAPIGGGFEDSWRPDVRGAIERGWDVVAGLHYLLAEDDEFARLADQHGVDLRDVRDPPADLSVATGEGVDARVVLTVGTDCSSGKMTGSFELRDAARERGLDAAVVPTGQTGIMITGWGIAIDRVISDFAAGATERLLRQAADNDVLFVEGQGALTHPAYSGVTAAILHGSHPDALVLCHVAGRETVGGYDAFDIPDPATYARRYEQLADPVSPATVDAGLLNTQTLDEGDARRAVDTYSDQLGVPVTDPVRYDVESVLDAVLA
ncbi:MAG: hypothetical protein J07HX64_01388 [halophilic archaeon J07HX64]|jgi:Uncharacterized conserved protein|nr:MAG: hypothetical protein J07HX64_01388 [halophilic archaeon J07HX64]